MTDHQRRLAYEALAATLATGAAGLAYLLTDHTGLELGYILALLWLIATIIRLLAADHYGD